MASDGRPRVGVVHGLEGSGLTLLGEIAGDDVREVHHAVVLRGLHHPLPRATDGAIGALIEHLGCGAMDSHESLTARLTAAVEREGLGDEDEAYALAAAAWPQHEIPPLSAEERYALLHRLLGRLSRRSPVLLIVDDAQWGLATLGLAAHLLERRSEDSAPVLLLMLLQRGAEGPDTPGRVRIDLGDVREALRPHGGAWELEMAPPPSTFPRDGLENLELWLSRYGRSVGALERLAALGGSVAGGEWRDSRDDVSDDCLLAAEAAGFVRRWREGWRFTHDSLARAILERTPRERLYVHHRVCAMAIEARYGRDFAGERVAVHLLACGDGDDAIRCMRTAVRLYRRGGEVRVAERLLSDIEDIANALALPSNDLRRGEILEQRATLLRMRGRLEESVRSAERAIAFASTAGEDGAELHARALRTLALTLIETDALDRGEAQLLRAKSLLEDLGADDGVAEILGDLAVLADRRGLHAEAELYARESIAVGERLGDRHHVASTRVRLALALRQQGRLQEALDVYVSAEQLARAVRNRQALANSLRGQANILRTRGDDEGSVRLLRAAMEVMDRVGNQLGMAHCLNGLAESARKRGDLKAAERDYRRALSIFEMLGSGQAIYPKVNLGLVLLGRGLTRQAREQMDEARLTLGAAGRQGMLGAVLVTLLPCLVAERDWEEWESCYQQATHLLAATRQVDADIAWAAELSGDWSEVAAKHPIELSFAARSFEIALAQYVGLGDIPASRRVSDRLEELARAGAPLPLGPFDLTRRLGEGGTGEVWQGVHRLQRVPVAVKVLTQEVAREPMVLESFAHEVRAVAALEHPNVIIVLEHGKVSETAAIMSSGRLVARSPYLAMELCVGGTLAGACGRISWPECRRILLSLLDALAHAHARGVIHRDIKPANVLLDAVMEARPNAKLSDFGIAHALRGGPLRSLAVGTPEYMAPEQFTGEWRSYGPWTDLYSIGCVATALVQGSPPFVGTNASALAQSHWMDEPPPLAAQVPVPAALESWIRRLLCKRPADRFQRAADAAFALEQLGPPVVEGFARPAAVHVAHTTARTFVFDDFDTPVAGLAAVSPGTSVEPIPVRHPAAPVEWRPHKHPAEPIALRGAGLALYGLRPVPITGREAEQDALWATLINVLALSECRAVLLRGPAGCGKTRLASWLGERAHALGVANLLRVHARRGQRWALVGAIAERMRCDDLTGEALRTNVDRWLSIEGQWSGERAAALVELIEAWRTAPALSEVQRRILKGVLLDFSSPRPLVITVESAQWAAEELALCREMLADGAAPVLFVFVTRDDLLIEAPESCAHIAALRDEPLFGDLYVGPLKPAEHLSLVRALLDLEETLAAQVAQRTAGNVLFAMELIGDWVRRDLLQLGDGGFHLRSGAQVSMPEHLHQRWAERVDRAVTRLGPQARVALESLALSGAPACAFTEWQAACAAADGALTVELAAALGDEMLVLPEGAGWAIVHAMLRESLERSAAESGRSIPMRRAWARLLEGQALEGDRARLALLRMRAGEPEQALSPLRAAVLAWLGQGRPESAAELLDLWEEALRVMGAAEDDPRWGEQLLALSETCSERAYWRESQRHAERLLTFARRYRWDHLVAPALRLAALGAEAGGEWDDAWGHLVDAREIFRFRSDQVGVARCTAALGSLARTMGRLDEGLEYLNDALEQLTALSDEVSAARVRCSLANVALAHEDLDEAERQFQDALRQFKRHGYRVGEGEARNGLGEVHRYRGDLEAAEAAYRLSLEMLSTGDSAKALVPRLNLGLVLLARGQYDEASAVFEEVQPSVLRRGRHIYSLFLSAFRLAAMNPGLSEWDQLCREVQHQLRDHRIAEPDIAWPLERAAQRAKTLGHAQQARALYQIVLEQWDRMETDEAVERVKAAMREL